MSKKNTYTSFMSRFNIKIPVKLGTYRYLWALGKLLMCKITWVIMVLCWVTDLGIAYATENLVSQKMHLLVTFFVKSKSRTLGN